MTDEIGSAVAGNPEGNAAPPTEDWRAALPEDMRAEPSLQSHKDIASLAKSYVHAQKMVGHSPDRLLVLPGEKATPEEIRAFQSKIGVPETADGYKFELGEGADENMVGWFRQAAHKAGIPASAAGALVKEWEGFSTASQKQAQEAETAQRIKDHDEWKAGLGSKYDEHLSGAKRALTALGVDFQNVDLTDGIDALAKTLGKSGLGAVDWAAKLYNDYGIGKESDMQGGGTGGMGASSPESARAALVDFENSDEWMKARFDKQAPNRADLIAKRDRLYAAAYPDMGEGITIVGRAS